MTTLNDKLVSTFDKKYNSENFTQFINELLVGIEPRGTIHHKIPDVFKDYIKCYRRIGKYKYKDGYEKIIDVIEVTLKRTSSVEKARSMQRNFVARYLNGAFGGTQRDAALVAFISEDENKEISPDWRFSFVKMDYKVEIVEDENGNKKRKIGKELTPAKRFSFLVGDNEGTHTAQSQLKECLDKAVKKEKITLEDLTQAFDIEKVSKEFFTEYKGLYEKLVDELKRLYKSDLKIERDFDEHNIVVEDFAKKTLGQLVFLYFIQKKGWLGVKSDENWGKGDKKFLRNLFNGNYKKYDNFFNDILEPLFYEALASDRGVGARFEPLNCRIPFLNGGLFEPINNYRYDRTDLTIDNKIFEEIFKTFELYNFTVKEDEPLEKEVAIDPEMLGKVFENLLPENIRKGNGAFYTPREIVHYMCQESLVNYLYNKVNTKEVQLTEDEKQAQLKLFKKEKRHEQLKLTHEVFEEKISKDDIAVLIKKGDSIYSNKSKGVDETLPKSVEDNAKELDEALKNIKVCDPAIGSGAFPVGMMNEIVRARMALNKFIGDPNRSVYQLKRNVIENSVYGVDLDAGAVEISKLRFWLSLVVDEEDVQNIKPLPNLDYKIMQGNSLITSYEGIDFDKIVESYVPTKQLDLFAKQSESVINQIQVIQQEFLKTPYAQKKNEIKQEIENQIVELVKVKFEEKAVIEGKPKNYYEEHIRNFAQNKENRNFFPWKLFFADAFEQGGFDVVIGNPPYGVSIKGEYRKNVENKLGRVPDYEIYYYFIELAYNLLKNRSTLSYIIPNTYLFNTFAEKYRIKLLENWDIKEILDCSKFEIFESATVRNTINLYEKGKTIKVGYRCTKGITSFESLLTNPRTDVSLNAIMNMNQNWGLAFLLDKSIIDLISKIKNNSKILINYFPELSQGLIAYDKYQGQSEEIIKNRAYHYKEYSKPELKKWLWGADVCKYTVKWNGKEYIDYCTGIANPREPKYFKGKRLLIREITNPSIYAAITDKELYNDPSIIIVLDKNKKIEIALGILNSKLATFYHFNNSPKAIKGAFPKILVKDIKEFPIPDLNQPICDLLKNIVVEILKLTQSEDYLQNTQKQDAVKEYERQIDDMVYQLYGLTEDEILVIEPNRLIEFKFDKKPSTKEIVTKIASLKPSLMDNDREFCYIFDKLALNNGYLQDELPSYWTIGRSIYNYKQENEIKASDDAQTTSTLINDVDLNNPILKRFIFDKSKPSIKNIIKKIAEFNERLLNNDRQLIELFDGIALTNGYEKIELPKYWTIIRAVFDYKKEFANVD